MSNLDIQTPISLQTEVEKPISLQIEVEKPIVLGAVQNGIGIGPRGFSNYQLAVQEGFEGTLDEWLNSLIGPQGDPGEPIELRITNDFIQWKYIEDIDWINLISILEITGPQGLKGDQGIQGLKGDQGIQGLTGSQGLKGDKGEKGIQGDQGLSAYEIAIEEGFVGIKQEWLQSLKGIVYEVPFIEAISVVVTHNKGMFPIIQVLDNLGEQFIPFIVKHNSKNVFTVTFDSSETGTILYIAGDSLIVENNIINRYDYVVPYNYCGIATTGSLEENEVWTISRIQINTNGTNTVTHAYDVAWDDRLTTIYT